MEKVVEKRILKKTKSLRNVGSLERQMERQVKSVERHIKSVLSFAYNRGVAERSGYLAGEMKIRYCKD